MDNCAYTQLQAEGYGQQMRVEILSHFLHINGILTAIPGHIASAIWRLLYLHLTLHEDASKMQIHTSKQIC